jgi:protein SCO1
MAAAAEPRARALLATWRRWLWFLVLGACLSAVALCSFVLGKRYEAARETTLPVLAAAPSYTMTNQLGAAVSSSGFAGKVQIVTFLFPYCTTMCPLIAAHLTNLETLGLRPAGIADKVAIVSFNIDPESTGPTQMRAFMRQYGWNPHDTHWQYLVAAPAEMRRVVSNGFSVWYKRVSLAAEDEDETGTPAAVQPEVVNKLAEQSHADYDIVHNDVLAIVDQQGRIRKIYDDADSVGWPELLNVVQSLVKPSSQE